MVSLQMYDWHETKIKTKSIYTHTYCLTVVCIKYKLLIYIFLISLNKYPSNSSLTSLITLSADKHFIYDFNVFLDICR